MNGKNSYKKLRTLHEYYSEIHANVVYNDKFIPSPEDVTLKIYTDFSCYFLFCRQSEIGDDQGCLHFFEGKYSSDDAHPEKIVLRETSF